MKRFNLNEGESVVGMLEHNGRVFVATNAGVYVLESVTMIDGHSAGVETFSLKPIEFVFPVEEAEQRLGSCANCSGTITSQGCVNADCNYYGQSIVQMVNS